MQLPYLHFSAFFFNAPQQTMLTVPVEEQDEMAGIFLVTVKYHTDREKGDLKNIFTEVI